ncbi:tetratricopeptide repeat protein [Dactylosporangium sp. NPDC051485]|uniref:tetratricopeptide repeat protein n=1 Tax=Dactylosporangium sp. NPDC051485 TaxID=3154846 RepID=UPI0034316DE3
MARKDRNTPRPDHRRRHAERLVQQHAGHRCGTHADNLILAAMQYLELGEDEPAERAMREAVGIEDAEPGRPHATYILFLLERGRTDEARALLSEVRRLRPQEPFIYGVIAAALATHGQPEQAARWYTAGLAAAVERLADLEADDVLEDPQLLIMAVGRRQVRASLGLEPDHIDLLVTEVTAAA